MHTLLVASAADEKRKAKAAYNTGVLTLKIPRQWTKMLSGLTVCRNSSNVSSQ